MMNMRITNGKHNIPEFVIPAFVILVNQCYQTADSSAAG